MRNLFLAGLLLITATCYAEDAFIFSNFLEGTSDLSVVLKTHESREINEVLEFKKKLNDTPNVSSKTTSFTWRGFARISAIVVSASFLGAGIYENKKAIDIAEEYNSQEVRMKNNYKKAKRSIERRDTLRNAYYGIASAFLALGVVTFFF